MTHRNIKLFMIFGFALLVTPFTQVYDVHAATRMELLQITPTIIDAKFKKGEFTKEKIIIENGSGKTMQLYPFVYYVDLSGKWILQEEAKVGREASLAAWLNFPRNVVEFFQGKERQHELTVLISPSPHAKPGIYHAVIAFAEGGDREVAKKNLTHAKTVMINAEFIEKIVERLQIKKFISDKLFVLGSRVGFTYKLENNGNHDVIPEGEIRIYDRRGAEVKTLPINASKSTITPSSEKQLGNIWSAIKGIGRYKATLNLYYGERGQANVQDTIFIWIMPWPYIIGIAFFFIVLASILIKLIYRKTTHNLKNSVIEQGHRIRVIDIRHHDIK